MTKQTTPALRFAPTIWASLLHLLLMADAFALFLGRKPGGFRSQAIADAIPGFYTHVFNFSLSYLLYAGIGFLWLMMGVPMRFVAWAGAALVRPTSVTSSCCRCSTRTKKRVCCFDCSGMYGGNFSAPEAAN